MARAHRPSPRADPPAIVPGPDDRAIALDHRVLTGKLPNGLTYVAHDAAGDYDSATGDWNVGLLDASGSGATATLSIVATVNDTIYACRGYFKRRQIGVWIFQKETCSFWKS